MVIGNGLLANAFCKYKENKDVLIFASGVSNSKLTEAAPFQREIDLVQKHLNFNGLFVYFSTCSVSDPTLQDSQYIQHKLNIENIIQKGSKNFLIVRLPNVVGVTSNPNTMLNFFTRAVLNSQPIQVQRKSARYLIDVDDVYRIIDLVITQNSRLNVVGDLVNGPKILVENIVSAIEKHFQTNTDKVYIEGNSNYDINAHSVFKPFLSPTNADVDLFLKKILEKYY